MATTKCDCICVPREEYERLKAADCTGPRKPKRPSTKAKAPAKAKKPVQRTARPKQTAVMVVEQPVAVTRTTRKVTKTTKKTPQAKKSVKRTTTTKKKPKTVVASPRTVRIVEPDEPRKVKRNTPYNGATVQRRVKEPKQIEAPRTVIIKEQILIEGPKAKKEHKLANKAKGKAKDYLATRKARKEEAKAWSNVKVVEPDEPRKVKEEKPKKLKTEYSVDYSQPELPAPKRNLERRNQVEAPKTAALPAPKQETLPARNLPALPEPKKEPVIRQLEPCEGKGFLAKRACKRRNREITRDY